MARETECEAFFGCVWRAAVAATQPYVGVDEASDIATQVALRLWRHRDRYPAVLESRTELERLAVAASRRVLLNHDRNRRLRAAREGSYAEARLEAHESLDASHGLIEQELSAVTSAVIAALPARAQEAWRLVHDEGRTHADAAERMRIAKQTVNVHLCRALVALREAVDHYRRDGGLRSPRAPERGQER